LFNHSCDYWFVVQKEAIANSKPGEALPAVIDTGTPMVGGFKFLRTPSPAPGRGGESPFMTWGDVVGTPLHLEDEDTAASAIGGLKKEIEKRPKFHVPKTPSRDDLAHRLAERAKTKQKKSTSSSSSGNATPNTPNGRSSIGTPTTTTRMMSPAAHRLAAKLGVRVDGPSTSSSSSRVDAQLRASYSSPSPLRQSSTPRRTNNQSAVTPSPLINTPSPARPAGHDRPPVQQQHQQRRNSTTRR
jgi:pyruvate/2-oxoglutarate dehydrogenase complex dihydrolipoamide acyltransferase (E2) component